MGSECSCVSDQWRRRAEERLTVHGVEFDAVRCGRPVRSPFDAELVVVDVEGLDVGDIQVNCRGQRNHISPHRAGCFTLSFTYDLCANRCVCHPAAVHTCGSLSRERCAHAAGVLSYDFDVVGGSRLQVVQSVRAHVAHKEVDGLGCACKHNGTNDTHIRH